jgi:PPM family protein phosphatase
MRVTICGQTHPGTVRDHNEDNYWYDETLGAAVVSDGMGGHVAGDVASSITVKTFEKAIRSKFKEVKSLIEAKAIISTAISNANLEVISSRVHEPSLHNMGATIVATCMWNRIFLVAHLGDSRAYLIREGRMKVLTKDHLFIRKLLEKGEITEHEAKIHPQRNRLTRYIGNQDNVKVDLTEVSALSGDLVLLCTDGLTSVVSEDEIVELIRKQPDSNQLCGDLVHMALDNGTPDNVTVVLLKHEEFL